MKDNKNILNEAFFKKSTYTDNLKKRMPAYEPVKSGKLGFGGQVSMEPGVFAVTDTNEIKKRLTGTFGAAFGDNNIKSMASKAVKVFPVIVSDNIEPETVLSLKKLMEEQYADYISLLISNKVIDLGAFETSSPDGSTIAIQALDSISGTDFSKNRIANKATNTGEISIDDFGANIPLYNLLRENHIENISTGDKLFDELLENALVVPSDSVDEVVKYINENAEDLFLNETHPDFDDATTVERSANNQPHFIENKKEYYGYLAGKKDAENVDSDKENIADAIQRTATKFSTAKKRIEGYDELLDTYSGKRADGIYDRLSNAEIVVDKAQFDTAMNRTVGELLMDPKNAAIKDRFEKASILLQAEMISGSEYIDYCTMRLGIPISATARATISARFRRVKTMDRKGNYKNNIFMTEKDAKKIKNNQKVFDKVAPKILSVKIGSIVAGAASGVTTSGIGALLGIPGGPVGIAIGAISGAVVGSGAYFIYKLIKKYKDKKTNNKIEGWERVEMLIETLDKQRADVIARNDYLNNGKRDFNTDLYKTINDKSSYKGYNMSAKTYQGNLKFIDDPVAPKEKDEDALLNGEQIDAIQKQIQASLVRANVLTESEELNTPIDLSYINSDYLKESVDLFIETYEECLKDEEFRNASLEESLFKKKETSMPMKVKYIEKKPGKDILFTPEFSARSVYAYGSTEIDNKVMKDRKYNQPLLMTIKFKQRFDDGKYADNELTAVIGILGKVIRVPSNEMKYILSMNADGKTINNAFKTGDMKNMVSDLLSVSKISDESRNIPKSSDVWKNLEKVAALAIANKYSGKKSGNVANAHIVFSEKEIDDFRIDTGIDYKRDMQLVAQLMKKYSAFTIIIADDPAQRVYIYNDEDDISWNVVPYSAIVGKDTGDQLTSALSRLSRVM